MSRVRSMTILWKFTTTHAAIFNLFSHQRHFLSRAHFKDLRNQSVVDWRQICVA